MIELENVECSPSVHFLDLIKDYHLDMSIEELERHYKAAVVYKDLQLLPAPYGLRSKVPSDCRLQMVMSKDTDGNYTILKHIVFPNKCKASVMKQLVYGVLHRPNFMHIPTKGRTILQYCLQNMGGLQFRCFDLTADVPTSKNKKVFDELEDDLDKGFDYISKHAPRSWCDLQQLRWQTKELRKSSSPIFGWPQGLAQQALRQLSAEGASARKEYAWPLPLTPVFFHTWLLEMLEEIWNFDLSALVMLGEPVVKALLVAVCWWRKVASTKRSSTLPGNLASDVVRKLICIEVRQARSSWEISLTIHAPKALVWKLWSLCLMSACMKACPGPAGELSNGCRTSPVPWLPMLMKLV